MDFLYMMIIDIIPYLLDFQAARYSPRLQRDLGAVQRLAPKGEGFGSAARRNERGNGAGEAREKLGETGENQGKLVALQFGD